jgi:hypothetical protein
MNTRCFLFAALFAAGTATAFGQSKAPVLANPVTDNEYTFGRNAASPRPLSQRVLTARDAKRKSLLGLSPLDSILRASPEVRGRFVTNDTYSAGGTEYLRVSGLSIEGGRPANQSTAIGERKVANGIDLEGQFSMIAGNKVQSFYGSAIVVGALQLCYGNVVGSSFTAIECASSDSICIGNVGAGCRDYGLWAKGATGHIKWIGNHMYGLKYAGVVSDGATEIQSIGNSWADSEYGFFGAGPDIHLRGDVIKQNYGGGVIFGGSLCSMEGCMVKVSRTVSIDPVAPNIGVEFNSSAPSGQIRGGYIQLTNYDQGGQWVLTGHASHAVKVSANNCYVDTYVEDLDSVNGNKLLWVTGNTKGLIARITVTAGFEDARDRLFDHDAADGTNVDGLDIEIRSPTADTASPGNDIDIDGGWTGSIVLINTTTGARSSIPEGTAL